MSDQWWVISGTDLEYALDRVADYEDPAVVLAEFYANANIEPPGDLVNCPVCGKPFDPKPPGSTGRPRVYCSNLCRQRAWHQRHPQRSVPIMQWLHDCDTLLTAAMYGNPPGGWSDPERRAKFQADVADIEARMRAVSEGT